MMLLACWLNHLRFVNIFKSDRINDSYVCSNSQDVIPVVSIPSNNFKLVHQELKRCRGNITSDNHWLESVRVQQQLSVSNGLNQFGL